MFIRHGREPNEQTVKRLAILGCILLVVAHSIRNKLEANSHAGKRSMVV